MQSSSAAAAGASSSSMTTSATPSPLVPQQQPPSSATAASSVVVRGRNRELQQLNNEMQLLQEELSSLDNIPRASKACKDFVTFVENRADPFFPKDPELARRGQEMHTKGQIFTYIPRRLLGSDGITPQAWPYDRPVKASRWCWKF